MNNLNIYNFNELLLENKLSSKDMDFLVLKLKEYEYQEPDFFDYSDTLRNIFTGEYLTFLVKRGNEPRVLVVLKIKETIKRERYLYIVLITGSKEDDLSSHYLLNNLLEHCCRENKLIKIVADGRLGWEKYASMFGFQKRYVTYVKDVHQ